MKVPLRAVLPAHLDMRESWLLSNFNPDSPVIPVHMFLEFRSNPSAPSQKKFCTVHSLGLNF